MGRSSASGDARCGAVLVALLLSGGAFAGVTIAQFPPNPGVMPGGGWEFTKNSNFANPPSTPRAWVNGNYGTPPVAGVKVIDTIGLQGKGGAMSVEVARTAARPAILKGAALALRALPVIGTGILLWDIWDDLRVSPAGDGVGLRHDPGVPPVVTNGEGYCATAPMGGQQCAPTMGGLAEAFIGVALVSSGYPAGNWPATTCFLPNPVNYPLQIMCQNAYGNSLDLFGQLQQTQSEECPASIDPFNSAYSIPVGAAPDEDGMCRTARYHHQPITPDAARDLASDPTKPPQMKPDDSQLDDIADDVVGRGVEIDAEPHSINGPTSQPGTPTSTTTTGPGGTTTKTETPTYNYTYSPTMITVTTTTTTLTCIGSNVCTPETATETETEEERPPDNPCELNPNSLGCMELGEPPGDEIPKSTQNIAFSPESVGSGEGCPAPVPLPHGQEISYQTVCDGVTTARPLIIAMGFFMAAGIMVGGFKLE